MIKTKTKTKNKKFSIKLVNYILFAFIIVIGISYLICINDLSVKSFHIQELKQQISQLRKENIALEEKILAINSYNNLEQKVTKLDMVEVEEIKYISGISTVAIQK